MAGMGTFFVPAMMRLEGQAHAKHEAAETATADINE
jgi:hypothetical protein